MWAGTKVISRKSPVAWKKMCYPCRKGGLNIMDMQVWSKANMAKNLWNVQTKVDSLWIQWVHIYYVKGVDIMNIPMKQSTSWILKSILKLRDQVKNMQEWGNMVTNKKFITSKMYWLLNAFGEDVAWKYVLKGNVARARAI